VAALLARADGRGLTSVRNRRGVAFYVVADGCVGVWNRSSYNVQIDATPRNT
jgi:hypothetical protein